MTAAAPPSAETVWLRMGYTLEITATLSLGLVSTAAMAARSPAPPPPTISTSQEEISMRAQVFQAAKLLCYSLDVNCQGRAIHTRLAISMYFMKHLNHMKTTVEVPDSLLEQARRLASK